MKTTLLTLILSASTFLGYSQESKYFGDIQIGTGVTHQGRTLYNGTIGFNTVLGNDLYLRLGADFALGGGFKNPNSVVNYNLYSLRIGWNNTISEKFTIRPYVGGGYQMGVQTTRIIDRGVELVSGVGSLIGVDVDTRYESENFSSIVAPIGVDFHIHGKNVGFVTGMYFNISQYMELGLRVGITFGKL